MSCKKIINKSKLPDLFAKILAGNSRILAPVRDDKERLIFREVASYGDVAGDYIQTTLSAKEAVFPRNEEVLGFRLVDKEVRIIENTKEPVPTVVFGGRPRDARSFATLTAVFMRDYEDIFFKKRMETTTVISLACPVADEYCFCTSTGGGPGDTAGSDILLLESGDDSFVAEILTGKGEAILSLAPELFSDAAPGAGEVRLADVKKKFDISAIREKINNKFDTGIWMSQSLRCLGCGACAYACPACTCFDLQDEKKQCNGARVRCWDSCGYAQFTVHTSGHNPRENQSQRWRQRLMHKFSYQPEMLEVSGRVGCGRCSRACPVDMNILEHLVEFMEEN